MKWGDISFRNVTLKIHFQTKCTGPETRPWWKFHFELKKRRTHTTKLKESKSLLKLWKLATWEKKHTHTCTFAHTLKKHAHCSATAAQAAATVARKSITVEKKNNDACWYAIYLSATCKCSQCSCLDSVKFDLNSKIVSQPFT